MLLNTLWVPFLAHVESKSNVAEVQFGLTLMLPAWLSHLWIVDQFIWVSKCVHACYPSPVMIFDPLGVSCLLRWPVGRVDSGEFRPSDPIWGRCALLVRMFGVKLVVEIYFVSGPACVRHGGFVQPCCGRVGPRPFAHFKAEAIVDGVMDLTMWLQSIGAVQADFVSARRLSSSLALLGFTHWSHLGGVNCESLHIKNPVQSALLARAEVKASHDVNRTPSHVTFSRVSLHS